MALPPTTLNVAHPMSVVPLKSPPEVALPTGMSCSLPLVGALPEYPSLELGACPACLNPLPLESSQVALPMICREMKTLAPVILLEHPDASTTTVTLTVEPTSNCGQSGGDA